MIREKFQKLVREKSIDDYLPFSSLVADDVVMCRNGELIGTFKLTGIAFETKDDDVLDLTSHRLNTFYRTLAQNHIAIQIHRVRRVINDRLTSTADSDFANSLIRDYNNSINNEGLMATELYFTLIHRPKTSLPSLGRNKARSAEEIMSELSSRIEQFQKDMVSIKQSLSEYGPIRLGQYKEKGLLYSDQLSFYNFLVTGQWQPVRVHDAPLSGELGNVQVFIGSDTLQLQSAFGSTFCQGVELKDFTQATYSGILNDLLYTGNTFAYPFVETQTFAFLSKQDGLRALKLQQRQLLSSNDASVSQIYQMNQALDAVASGEFAIGEYSYSLLIMSADPENLKEYTGKACDKLKDAGFIPFISTLALAGSYLSQIPCNFEYRPRLAKLTTVNFAHLAPLHNYPIGKRDANPWGEAVAILKTPTSQPYYFNFHDSPIGEDSFGKKLLGNTTVLGSSGTGKTATMNFLIAMMQKYRSGNQKLTTVYFDKDRGAEIAIRAFGGGYLTIENGKPTGFNPFALDSTPENIQFLNRFCKLLLSMDGQPVTTSDELKLSQAIQTVMSMPKSIRRLALLVQNMNQGQTREEIENSVAKRLAKWLEGGDLGWVFDNPKDELDFDRFDDFGIDGTDFLDNKEIRSPVAYYLLYRMESVIDGRRFMFVMDEFWKWLLDEAFRDFAFNKLKTIRKQNGFGVFVTQSPSEILKSDIAKAVIEQSATFIFLPNPQADHDDYVNGFKVTENEFNIIRNLEKDSRLMLVKQGQHSVLCRLDLGPFPNALKVLSGSTDSVNYLDKLRAVVGNNPRDWMPYFLGEKLLKQTDHLQVLKE